jgi:hypothetical protein
VSSNLTPSASIIFSFIANKFYEIYFVVLTSDVLKSEDEFESRPSRGASGGGYGGILRRLVFTSQPDGSVLGLADAKPIQA